MEVLVGLFQIIAIFTVPILIIKHNDTRPIKFIGTIGCAYLLGLIISLIRFAFKKINIDIPLTDEINEIGSYAAIALAIPLLLFSSNLSTIKQLSKQVALTFLLLILSVVAVAAIVYLGFKDVFGDISAKYAGMAIGLYTGGTPNLNGIGTILKVSSDNIAVANLSDMVFGGVFYIFLLFGYKPILSKILKHKDKNYLKAKISVENADEIEKNKIALAPVVKNFFIALSAVALSAITGVVLWLILGAKDGTLMDLLVPILLIGVTVLGIAFSFLKKVRNVKGSNLLGHFFILVFSFALASAVDISTIDKNMLLIFAFFGIITLGTLIVHSVLCYIFKIDMGCALVVLTAGIYGPAFVPAVARQLDSDELTVAGLICGSLGYAVGTFLGLGFAYLFLLI